MIIRNIIYFLVLSHIVPSENKATPNRFPTNLVRRNPEKKYNSTEGNHADLKCKYKCITANELGPAKFQARLIEQPANGTTESNEMVAPAAKVSFLNLLSDDEEDHNYGDDENDDDDDDNDADIDEDTDKIKNKDKEEEEEEEGDDDDDDDISFNFFGPEEEEIDVDKVEGTKGENLLKQYHRHTLHMHNLVFPLLLAYKLKFFTVIPLLLGSLVLLIGTTGFAGFFFALFAAALGIHVKTQHH